MGLKITASQLNIRDALPEDRNKLANLTHFEAYVHRHLDWRGPLEWIGARPYLVLEERSEIVAALACPPEPPEIAWIRLFSAGHKVSYALAWSILWPEAQNQLLSLGVERTVAAIPLWPWFGELLSRNGFVDIDRVIMLAWQSGDRVPERRPVDASFRPMIYDDLDEVQSIDGSAFGAVWQNALSSLDLAYRQATVATVAQLDNQLVGYQISTATANGGHLARLAVRPEYQGRGIGYELLRQLIAQFKYSGAQRITVNTQKSNLASLSLYRKMGFVLTGEEYPVLKFTLPP